MADPADPAASTRKRSWIARIVAPLALLAAVGAVALIISGSLGSDDEPANDRAGKGGGGETTRTTTDEPEPEQTENVEKTYEVQAGDSLSSIADQFGLSVEELQSLNPDVDPQALATGQTLKLR